MELTKFLAFMAAVLPIAYGAPAPVADSLAPEVMAAMKRDLGLDSEQAHARVARDVAHTETIDQLKSSLGEAFAGAWISEEGKTLNVAVSDKTLAADVTAAGAKVVTVANSLSKLEAAKAALDAKYVHAEAITKRAADLGIAAYYIDVTTNKLVLEALSSSTAEAEALAAEVGLSASEFDVVTVDAMPTPYITIQGGTAYYINLAARCSIGFTVTTGFVSAGHCGTAGSAAEATTGASIGTFSASVFPGNADMSYIRTTSGQTLSGTINRYGATAQAISGSTVAGVGSSICRSGSTSGVHCGTVGALGATVNYSEGSVTGLTRTSVCAEPGDSGGPFYTGAQAQGVTSGGSGDCTSGGTTYFQPVNEILSTYGLTLVKG
ncbi:trypsin [Xylariaceae sp. FL1019]|nr:trypsin [Xylariaceae sp. FL1019]